MYKYHGFGLNIASEMEMPELFPHDFDEADLTISIGKVPEALNGTGVIKRAFSLIGENEYTLNVKNVCRYYAGLGTTIIAEPYEGIDDRSIRVFLLGTIMAAILYQRGKIPLHVSAVVKDGKIILFAGQSGAGKSTLLASLSKKGYTVFTDDICVLELDKDSNRITGAASYPMMKLWEDAINKIGDDTFDRDFKVRPHLPKYGQFFHDNFLIDKLPVDKVFLLNPENKTNEITANNLDSLAAFKRVEKQAYKYRFATGDRLRALHFSLMSTLVNTVPVIELHRPAAGNSIEAFSDFVETLL